MLKKVRLIVKCPDSQADKKLDLHFVFDSNDELLVTESKGQLSFRCVDQSIKKIKLSALELMDYWTHWNLNFYAVQAYGENRKQRTIEKFFI